MELTRLSNESAASAVQEGTAEAVARADRNAQRVAAAGAALASAEVIDWRSAPRCGSRPTHPTLVQSQQPVAHSSALTSAGAAVGEAPVRGRRSSDYAELKRQVESAGLMGSQRHYFLAKLGANALLFGMALVGLRTGSHQPVVVAGGCRATSLCVRSDR